MGNTVRCGFPQASACWEQQSPIHSLWDSVEGPDWLTCLYPLELAPATQGQEVAVICHVAVEDLAVTLTAHCYCSDDPSPNSFPLALLLRKAELQLPTPTSVGCLCRAGCQSQVFLAIVQASPLFLSQLLLHYFLSLQVPAQQQLGLSSLKEGNRVSHCALYLSCTSPLCCPVTCDKEGNGASLQQHARGTDTDCSMPPKLRNLNSCCYDLPRPMLN